MNEIRIKYFLFHCCPHPSHRCTLPPFQSKNLIALPSLSQFSRYPIPSPLLQKGEGLPVFNFYT